jgi:hypothetical protein
MMRILIAGDWHSDLHEEVVLRSLRRLGHELSGFKWHSYFSPRSGTGSFLPNLLLRAQNKFATGPAISRISRDFVAAAVSFRPDLVFIYRGTHINSKALRHLRKVLPQCRLVGYNNDDPFSPAQPAYLWRHFLEAVPEYDLMLAYRHANMEAFRAAGARRVELMRSWYVEDRNFPTILTEEDQANFATDVVFVGHFEPDQRLSCLEEVVRQGLSLRIFGPTKYWAQPLENSPVLRNLAPTRMVWGEDYNRALCGAKVALCFFSKLNRDTYTRRCFEIPATRTLMLSEYSDDLASIYAEGAEADYFRSLDEMMKKIKMYVADDAMRKRVAEAGYRKVKSGGHDVDSRMQRMLAWVQEIGSVSA